jgi:hypothetical protein
MMHIDRKHFIDNPELIHRPATALNIVDEAQTKYSVLWEKEKRLS